jgi:20S proteasome alpha/beta subunit
LDPSGTFIEYDAKAIGSGSEGAQQNLQDVYHKVKWFLDGTVRLNRIDFVWFTEHDFERSL